MPGVLIHLVLLIVPFACIFQAQNLAEADQKLIQALCHNSETPETCMRCVTQAPEAEKANNVGIATIVINCISNQTQSLSTNFTRLASETPDKELKSIYQSCGENYSSTEEKLTSAKQYLQGHQYDMAENSVARATDLVVDCNNQLKGYNGTNVSVEVIFDINIYEELAEAACRIIEKIY